jgi:hypothetical protein
VLRVNQLNGLYRSRVSLDVTIRQLICVDAVSFSVFDNRSPKIEK